MHSYINLYKYMLSTYTYIHIHTFFYVCFNHQLLVHLLLFFLCIWCTSIFLISLITSMIFHSLFCYPSYPFLLFLNILLGIPLFIYLSTLFSLFSIDCIHFMFSTQSLDYTVHYKVWILSILARYFSLYLYFD